MFGAPEKGRPPNSVYSKCHNANGRRFSPLRGLLIVGALYWREYHAACAHDWITQGDGTDARWRCDAERRTPGFRAALTEGRAA